MHALNHPNEEEQAPWSEGARLSDTLQEVVPQLGELAQPSGPVPAEAENAEQPPQSRKAALGRVKTVKEDIIQIWDYGELRYNPNTSVLGRRWQVRCSVESSPRVCGAAQCSLVVEQGTC